MDRRVAGGCALLALGAVGLAQDPGGEGSPARNERTRAVTAPPDALLAAVAERVALDGVEVEIDADSGHVVVRRAGPPFDDSQWAWRRDPILSRVARLDEVLAEQARLRTMEDDELVRRFDEHFRVPPRGRWGGGGEEPTESADAVLLEIARRGGDAWPARLTKKLDALATWYGKTAGDESGTRSWDAQDLELLTALRRAQGAPDPVKMVVESVYGPDTSPLLPSVDLSMTVVDERQVTMTRGGNYRSGREQRYHVEVRDADGRLWPARRWQTGTGGGMFSRDRMSQGDALGTSLALGKYVEPLPPGTYRGRIHYHDRAGIGDPDDHLGLVTVVSEPFEFVVRRRVVVVPGKLRKRLAKLIGRLDPESEVQLLDAPYGEWAHGFIAPDSPAGGILAAGWPAAPVLVEAAAREELSPEKRAWFFALLYSITGQHDPARAGAIASYTQHGGGMRRVSGGGFSGSTRSVTSYGGISAEAQRELVAAWRETVARWEVR